jgi:hypothetical protein
MERKFDNPGSLKEFHFLIMDAGESAFVDHVVMLIHSLNEVRSEGMGYSTDRLEEMTCT